jgi:hypothetical protein
MMKLRLSFAAAALAAAAVSFAQAHATNTPGDLAANDMIDWGQFGQGATLASGTHGFTNNGIGFTYYSTNAYTGASDGGTAAVLQEGTTWNGIFNPGDTVLYQQSSFTNNFSVLTIIFDQAVAGAGAYVQSNAFGNFTVYGSFYDAAYPGGTNLDFGFASGNNTGGSTGTAPFLGVISTQNDVVGLYYAAAMDDNVTDDAGMGMGNVLVRDNAVPEPASMAALGMGALALIRRRRKTA